MSTATCYVYVIFKYPFYTNFIDSSLFQQILYFDSVYEHKKFICIDS